MTRHRLWPLWLKVSLRPLLPHNFCLVRGLCGSHEEQRPVRQHSVLHWRHQLVLPCLRRAAKDVVVAAISTSLSLSATSCRTTCCRYLCGSCLRAHVLEDVQGRWFSLSRQRGVGEGRAHLHSSAAQIEQCAKSCVDVREKLW